MLLKSNKIDITMDQAINFENELLNSQVKVEDNLNIQLIKMTSHNDNVIELISSLSKLTLEIADVDVSFIPSAAADIYNNNLKYTSISLLPSGRHPREQDLPELRRKLQQYFSKDYSGKWILLDVYIIQILVDPSDPSTFIKKYQIHVRDERAIELEYIQ